MCPGRWPGTQIEFRSGCRRSPSSLRCFVAEQKRRRHPLLGSFSPRNRSIDGLRRRLCRENSVHGRGSLRGERCSGSVSTRWRMTLSSRMRKRCRSTISRFSIRTIGAGLRTRPDRESLKIRGRSSNKRGSGKSNFHNAPGGCVGRSRAVVILLNSIARLRMGRLV